MSDKKRTNIYLNKEVYKRAKKLAVDLEIPVTQIINEGLLIRVNELEKEATNVNEKS